MFQPGILEAAKGISKEAADDLSGAISAIGARYKISIVVLAVPETGGQATAYSNMEGEHAEKLIKRFTQPSEEAK